MNNIKNIPRLPVAFWAACVLFWLNVIYPMTLTQGVPGYQLFANPIIQSILIGVIIFFVGKQLT